MSGFSHGSHCLSFLERDTVIAWVGANNLKDHGVFDILGLQAPWSYDTPGTTCQLTWHDIPEDLSHMQCGCENLNSCTYASVTVMNIRLYGVTKDPEYQILSVCNRCCAYLCKINSNKICIEQFELCVTASHSVLYWVLLSALCYELCWVWLHYVAFCAAYASHSALCCGSHERSKEEYQWYSSGLFIRLGRYTGDI